MRQVKICETSDDSWFLNYSAHLKEPLYFLKNAYLDPNFKMIRMERFKNMIFNNLGGWGS